MKGVCFTAVIVILLFSIFNPASSTTAAPDPTVNITIWNQWDDAFQTAVSAVFDQYEVDHSGVTISLFKTTDLGNALKVAIPSGTGPDIIGWSNDAIGDMVKRNFIIDLDQLGVTSPWLSSTFEPATATGVTYAGKIWARPTVEEAIALVYNKNLVSSSYLPTNPLDFTDVRTKAQAFQTATGKPLICNQGFPGGDAYHIAPVFFGFGVPSYIDDYGNAYANTAAAINAGAWLASMHSVSPANQDFTICQNLLIAGNVGMWWTGPWAISAIENGGVNYGIIPMGKPFVGMRTLSISSNAKDRGNAETALDIIQYFTNAANSKTLALANKTIPANTAALNDSALVQAMPFIVSFGAAAHSGAPMSSSRYAYCQWGPIGDAEAAIWNGSLTPAQALNIAQLQISACIFNLQTHIYIPVLRN